VPELSQGLELFYYYQAQTVTPPDDDVPYLADAQLNGALIVDPVGAVATDRVYVVNTMFVVAGALQKTIAAVTINGKSYPYTKPLEYTRPRHRACAAQDRSRY
jgi:hypothetical protein